MNADDIIKVMEKAKELGLKQVKCDGFEASFGDLVAQKPVMVVPDLPASEIVSPLSLFEEPDEDEIKYYSSPYYDVLMAEKEEKKRITAQQKELENG